MSDFKTFSRRPWITHDAVDENGIRAEVQVISGIGNVEILKPYIKEGASADSARSYQVKFKVDNNAYLIGGFCPLSDPITEILQNAFENKVPVGFRIEKVRQRGVDRSKPLSEISPPDDMKSARTNTYRNLVAVHEVTIGEDGQAQEGEWVISPTMMTRFEEDPSAGGSKSAYSMDLATFTGEDGTAKKPVNTGFSRSNLNSVNPEAPRWLTYNDDDTLNMGSDMVSAPLHVLSFVMEYNQDRELGLDVRKMTAVAKTLFRTASRLQQRVCVEYLEKPNPALASHMRARGIIYDLVKYRHPLTAETLKNKEHYQEWIKNLLEDGETMWQWSADLAK